MANVAVILSGCGFKDGAEIHESVFTLLALDQAGASYQCFAPNIDQAAVINHLTGETVPGETRNVLEESARIARGNILDVREAETADFDALILPGGFGAASNLCSFAREGSNMTIQDDVAGMIRAFSEAGKPVGFICIAPAMVARIYGKGARCTIGNDPQTAGALEAMGAQHQDCAVTDFVVDEERKIVSTPAYMLAQRISETHEGITRLVNQVLAMTE